MLLAIFSIEYFGRKKTLAILFGAAAIGFLLLAICSGRWVDRYCLFFVFVYFFQIIQFFHFTVLVLNGFFLLLNIKHCDTFWCTSQNMLPSDCAINGQYRKYAVLIGLYSYQHRSVQTPTNKPTWLSNL